MSEYIDPETDKVYLTIHSEKIASEAWNRFADEYNQWYTLCLEEKLEQMKLVTRDMISRMRVI